MSGFTTLYSLVRRCRLSQPCGVCYVGQRNPQRVMTTVREAFVVGFQYVGVSGSSKSVCINLTTST